MSSEKKVNINEGTASAAAAQASVAKIQSDERPKPASRMVLNHEYTNVAYYMTIKDPSLSQYYDKLLKIPPPEGWQDVFCLQVRDAKSCGYFIAAYEDAFGKL